MFPPVITLPDKCVLFGSQYTPLPWAQSQIKAPPYTYRHTKYTNNDGYLQLTCWYRSLLVPVGGALCHFPSS